MVFWNQRKRVCSLSGKSGCGFTPNCATSEDENMPICFGWVCSRSACFCFRVRVSTNAPENMSTVKLFLARRVQPERALPEGQVYLRRRRAGIGERGEPRDRRSQCIQLGKPVAGHLRRAPPPPRSDGPPPVPRRVGSPNDLYLSRTKNGVTASKPNCATVVSLAWDVKGTRGSFAVTNGRPLPPSRSDMDQRFAMVLNS